MISILLVAVLLVTGLACISGLSEISPDNLHSNARIVGGYSVNISQVPWQVSLHHFKYHNCGGSIIGNQWILTAAQCVDDAPTHRIRVGTSDRLTGGTFHEVEQTITHEKFAGLYDYDFGLIKLKTKLKFGEGVRSVRLPKIRAKDVAADTMCLVSGWGDTKNVTVTSRYLRAADVPIFDRDLCNERYRGQVTSRMLCAGYENGGKDACQGDSGGPLVVFDKAKKNPILIGIVSWGKGCAQPRYPGVYARVLAVRGWIREKTGI